MASGQSADAAAFEGVGVVSVLHREDWTVETFGSLAEFRNGLNFIQADSGQSVKILGVADFQTRKVFSSSDALNQVKIKGNLREEDILRRNDLLFVRSNGNKDLIGRCALIDFDESERVSFSGFTIRARITKRVLLPQLAAEIFSTNFIKRQISEASGGTNISNLSQDILAKLQIPLPPLPEQRRIAAILSQWDDSLSILTKLIEAKHQQKRGLAEQLLTGKRRLKGFEGEWEETKLGAIAAMSSGGTPKSNVPEYYGGGIPWVSISDMTKSGKHLSATERTLTPLGIKDSAAKVFPEGTILFAMYASIGKCNILRIPAATSQAILGIIPTAKVSPDYIYYFLSGNEEKYSGMGQHGTQKNLNAGMVKDLNIPLSPLPEQRAIASILSTLDEEITTLNTVKAKVQEQKRGLMDLLLTGKVRVKVDELQVTG